MIFRWAQGLWSTSFHQKRSETQNFGHPPNPIEPLFLRVFLQLLQSPSAQRKLSESHVIRIPNIVWTQGYPSVKNRGRTTRRSENIKANEKRRLKIEVQSDLKDVENSEFRYIFDENFCFKAPQLSEKSSEKHVICLKHCLNSELSVSKRIGDVRHVEVKILKQT